MTSTKSEDLKRVRRAIDAADLVLIGASNGLDMAEGLNIFAPDAHFRDAYGDLARACGANSILEGMFLSRADLAQAWAWQARFGRCEWLDYEPGPVMQPLRELVGDTDYFVLTCNMDARFARAGFDEHLVMETEGTVAKLTCTAGCCDERYPAADAVRALDASVVDGRVELALVPACPHCGAPLACALDETRMRRADVDAELAGQIAAFQKLVAQHAGENVVVLELGVGLRNGIIKNLLAQAVAGAFGGAVANADYGIILPHLTYAVFNYNQVVFPCGLEACCIGVDGDMAQAFQELASL